MSQFHINLLKTKDHLLLATSKPRMVLILFLKYGCLEIKQSNLKNVHKLKQMVSTS